MDNYSDSGSEECSLKEHDEDSNNVTLEELGHQLSTNKQYRKKHVRRCARDLKKEFPCYYNCGKSYATDAARNMHMRTKHNEGTKTERDRKARAIIRNCGLKIGRAHV